MLLKPWVAYALLWTFKVGVLAVLAGVVLLSRWAGGDGPSSGRPRGLVFLALLCTCPVVILAGQLLGFGFLPFGVAILGLCLYGFVRCLYRCLPLACILLPPLLLLCWGIASELDDRTITRIPLYSQRLSQTLLCRAYPYQADSVLIRRLVLVREAADWFRDEVVEEIVTYNHDGFACWLAPDGGVTMQVRSPELEPETKRVKLGNH